jgi:quercetin 2,3-dioxygenase
MTNRLVTSIISPPERHWVGDGFFVHGLLSPSQTILSPFALVDYNPAMQVEGSHAIRGVGNHPHRGFETVTFVYQGEISHQDSSGGGGVIKAGEVQWMTAGKGVIHNEFYEPLFNSQGGTVEFVQIWVNLPAKDKLTDPKYQHLTNLPKVEIPGGEVNIIAGNFDGVAGPAQTFTLIGMFSALLHPGSSVEFEIPDGHNCAVLVRSGSVIIGESLIESHHLAVCNGDGEKLSVTTTMGAEFLVLHGESIDEPLVSYGPFLMNTKEQIVEAIEDYNTGAFGEIPVKTT